MRSIKHIPEGGCHASELHKYKVTDQPNPEIPLGEGVTNEWIVTYDQEPKQFGEPRRKTFLVHAKTKEAAFGHFISLFPDSEVKALEYYGPYW